MKNKHGCRKTQQLGLFGHLGFLNAMILQNIKRMNDLSLVSVITAEEGFVFIL